MSRYNARKEIERGRMTHDDVERLIPFGPGRDHIGLTKAVRDILGMRRDGGNYRSERLLQRTKTGKHYRLPPCFAEIVGIETADTTDHSPLAEVTELATVHDTIGGIIRYVGASALTPAEIAPDLRWRWEVAIRRPEPVEAAYGAVVA